MGRRRSISGVVGGLRVLRQEGGSVMGPLRGVIRVARLRRVVLQGDTAPEATVKKRREGGAGTENESSDRAC